MDSEYTCCEHGVDHMYFCVYCNGNVEYDKLHKYRYDPGNYMPPSEYYE